MSAQPIDNHQTGHVTHPPSNILALCLALHARWTTVALHSNALQAMHASASNLHNLKLMTISSSISGDAMQALAQSQRPPSQGGQPLPEPPSPYLNPSQRNAAAPPALSSFGAQPSIPFPPTLGAAPFGVAPQPAPVGAPAGQQQFGLLGQAPAQPQATQAGRIQFGQKASQASSNPFGSSSQGQANSFQTSSASANPVANPFGQGSSQSGRLQFGTKAGQPAATHLRNSSSQGFAAPSGSQSFKPVTPFNSTADPFGRQKPGQAQQPAAQVPSNPNPFAQQQQQQQQSAGNGFNFNPFGQQQQPPATPAAFGGQAFQSQPSQGLEFQTPAVQQRPAFGGGVAASLQTPSPGRHNALHCY